MASTSTSPQSKRELVVVLVVASPPTSPQSEEVLVRLSSVILTSQQSEGELVVYVLVQPSAVMSVLSGCALLEQRHGFTGYSRRENVAGVDAFRVLYCWQLRRSRDGGLVPGCSSVSRCEYTITPMRQEREPQPGAA